jgi:hypothetical protein
MPGALDFDAVATLAALRAKRAAQGPLPTKAANLPNRALGALGELGEGYPSGSPFEATDTLIALRTRRTTQGAPPPKPSNPPNRDGTEVGGLDGLGGLGRGRASACISEVPACAVLTARRIAETVAVGAEREDDPAGWLVLVLPDGRRHLVAPHIFAALRAAGHLPDLPSAAPRSASPRLARPPSWSDSGDTPCEGDLCSCCRSRRWWTAAPEPDGWCCYACHPPPPGLAVARVDT